MNCIVLLKDLSLSSSPIALPARGNKQKHQKRWVQLHYNIKKPFPSVHWASRGSGAILATSHVNKTKSFHLSLSCDPIVTGPFLVMSLLQLYPSGALVIGDEGRGFAPSQLSHFKWKHFLPLHRCFQPSRFGYWILLIFYAGIFTALTNGHTWHWQQKINNCLGLESPGSDLEAWVSDMISLKMLRVWVWLLNSSDGEEIVIIPWVSLIMASFVHNTMF